mmetsp:Transcript_73056/g.205220  ORF Transcript_73056/g.205220 Transcript_73056/m.205220 type:complete len:148 (+) Transcript_73056:66-509(+)
MATSIEIQARGLTAQLGKAEADINQAAQNLEKAFKAANEQASMSGGQESPDPIKLIRQITALEIAIGNLKEDCATIALKRFEVVQKIVASQCQTVYQVKEILERTENEDPYSSREEIVDESWEAMTRSLEKQMKLVQVAQEGSTAAK